MPSPFPGMDPYLESRSFFPDLHDRLITRTSDHLQACLPEPYYAVVGSRLWVETSRRSIEPDVEVLAAADTDKGEGGVSIATRSKPVIIHVPQDENRETFVEIRSSEEPDELLVAVLEILSISNKTPGAHGRNLYRRKQKELLGGSTHLVEIDLLRGGRHTTAVPLNRLIEKAGAFDYHVSIHRFDDPENYVAYPVRLADCLPEIAVPLRPGVITVPLDLQEIFNYCYDLGPYHKRSPYREGGPQPPLNSDQTVWAKSILTERGIRPARGAR
jgi:hypothetical protein